MCWSTAPAPRSSRWTPASSTSSRSTSSPSYSAKGGAYSTTSIPSTSSSIAPGYSRGRTGSRTCTTAWIADARPLPRGNRNAATGGLESARDGHRQPASVDRDSAPRVARAAPTHPARAGARGGNLDSPSELRRDRPLEARARDAAADPRAARDPVSRAEPAPARHRARAGAPRALARGPRVAAGAPSARSDTRRPRALPGDRRRSCLELRGRQLGDAGPDRAGRNRPRLARAAGHRTAGELPPRRLGATDRESRPVAGALLPAARAAGRGYRGPGRRRAPRRDRRLPDPWGRARAGARSRAARHARPGAVPRARARRAVLLRHVRDLRHAVRGDDVRAGHGAALPRRRGHGRGDRGAAGQRRRWMNREGRVVSGAGGVLLIVSLFLPWAEVGSASRSGWELWTMSDVFFLITGLCAIGAAISGGRFGVFRPDVSLRGATDLLGIVAIVMLCWLLIFDFPAGADRGIGPFLALIAALAISGGAGDYRPLRGAPWFPKA